jgi:hypothetical protein
VATDPSAYSTVIVALSTEPTVGGAGSAAARTRIGVPHSQLAKSIMWQASPRMRPPPTRGSLSQWSAASGALTR